MVLKRQMILLYNSMCHHFFLKRALKRYSADMNAGLLGAAVTSVTSFTFLEGYEA
jgi:hypothetical protein